MKKWLIKKCSFVLIVILIVSIVPHIAHGDGAYTASMRGIILEAENLSISGDYVIKQAQNASNGKYVTTKSGAIYVDSVDRDERAEIEFTVNVPTTKRYAFWIRCMAPDTNSDSVFISYNSSLYIDKHFKNENDWSWQKAENIILKEGENVIKIHHRETNMRIDKIMLCEPRYVPSGMGKLPDSKEDYYIENPYSAPSFYPQSNIHPRLFVNSDILEDIKEKVNVVESGLPRDSEIYEAEHQNYLDKYSVHIWTGEPVVGNDGRYLAFNSTPVMNSANITEVDFSLEYTAKNAGEHAVWIHCLATTDGNDSVWWTANNSQWKTTVLGVSPQWHWKKLGNISLNEGVNEIKITHREPVKGLDRVLVTPDINATSIYNVPNGEDYESIMPIYDSYVQFKTFRHWDYNGTNPEVTDWSMKNYNINGLSAIQAWAFFYLINEEYDMARSAYTSIRNFVKTANFPSGNIDAVRNAGDTIFTAALVYDWCYDAISSEEKNELRDLLLDLQSTLETGFPPVTTNSVSGHMGENEVFRDTLSLAVAIYDEDPTLYNMSAGGFFQNMVPWYNYMYEGGYHSQGDSYGSYSRYPCELMAAYLFSSLGAGNVFSEKQKEIAYQYIYSVRPDGQRLRDGDSFHSGSTSETAFMDGTAMFLAGHYYKDTYINKHFLDIYDLLRRQTTPYIYYILFGDISLGTNEINTLPLTKFFNEPTGAMIARTGWNMGSDSNDAMAFFKIGSDFFGGHQHMDSGQFQIYYKGGLATDSGIYDSYGSTHDYQYNKRTIAHNSMLVYDPDETNVKDGGQRPLQNQSAGTLDGMLADSKYKLGAVLSYGFGPDENMPYYSYIKGDLTAAYSSKVEDFKRSFVFLNLDDANYPAAVIVFDKVTSSNPNFKKTWLLHSVEEPATNGNITVIKRTEYQYGGKLINTALLPEINNLQTTIVGGAGQDFLVNGMNYEPISYTNSITQEGIGYRLELSPVNSSSTDYFLNVMQVCDNDDQLTGQVVTKLETDNFAGAYVGKNLVIFSKDETLYSSMQFEIEQGTKTIIFGADNGMWKIEDENGNTVYSYSDAEDDALMFTATYGGTYTMTKLDTEIAAEVVFYNANNEAIDDFSPEATKAKITLINSEKEQEVSVYVASKNQAGVMEKVNLENVYLDNGERCECFFPITPSDEDYIEIFFWSSNKPLLLKQVFKNQTGFIE